MVKFCVSRTEIEFRADEHGKIKRRARMCLATGEAIAGTRG